MSKGMRNKARRRREKMLMIGLDLPGGQDCTAVHEPPVTDAEIFCANYLRNMLQEAGVEPNSAEWNMQIERAKELLMNHRQEIRHMFRDNKSLLEEWLFNQMVMIDGTGAQG